MLPSHMPNRFAPRVEARSQVLHYGIPVVGTGMSLNYASDRVPGRRAANQIRIPLKRNGLPHDVEEIALEVTVGERQFTQRFPATQASYTYTWEPPGDTVPGNAPLVRSEVATVRVGYVHRAIWPRPERISWKEFRAPLGVWDARAPGLGGWTLTTHHAFDPVSGNLYLGDGARRQLDTVEETPTGEWRIPSESTAEIYVFDTDGRHLRTLDGLTGAERFTFSHGPDGRLAGVRFIRGDLCRIERDREGSEIRILAPGAAQTSLQLDEAGYLRAVLDPGGGRVEVRHAAGGLLTEVVDPRGNPYRFVYDELGRLASEEHPGGGGSVLRRTTSQTGFTVRRSTATGIELTYSVERLAGGVTRRVNGCCAGGGQVVAVEQPDGQRMITYPDGSTLELEEQPDPRFGQAATILKYLVRRAPSGLSGEAIMSREVEAADLGDTASLRSQTDSLTLNRRQFVIHVDVADRRVTSTSPEGRTRVTTLDAASMPVASEADGFAAAQISRDTLGRIRGISMGGRQTVIDYDDRGRLGSIDVGAGRVARLAFDEADRQVALLSPSSRRRAIGYDASSNVTSITAPSGAVHRFSYGPTNLWTEYQPPGGERYKAGYDADGRPALIRLPSGREVRTEYDETGWMRAIRSTEAVVELRYDAGGHLNSADRKPVGDGPLQEMALTHDGPLVTSVSWRGQTTGRINYRFDASFRLAGIGLEGQPERELSRDGDGLIIAIGPFSVARAGPGGAVSSIRDARLTIETEFDDSGHVAGRVHHVNGREIYRLQIERDEIDRVGRREEILDGAAQSRRYAYDLDGQLVGVELDGSPSERYSYDPNGNRVGHEASGASGTAAFDSSDRLLSLGERPYQIDGDGFLRRRGQLTYLYGARGELLEATADDGTSVRYGHDALGRLVARTDAAGTEQYLHDHLAPIPQLLASRSPSDVLTEYYFDAEGSLFALLRGGEWFYVACDQIGSPRVVVDAEGRTVKVLDYDAFGRLVADSDPGFPLSIGFAGGVADAWTGLIHFGRRDYDPEAGRWTGPDPAGFRTGDCNLYRYVWNDPVSFTDRSGTQDDSPPNEQQSPTGPSFESQPRSLSEQLGFGGNKVDPSSWQEPHEKFNVTPSPTSPLTNLAGSEPTGGGRGKRGFGPGSYTYRGRWAECRGSVGGVGPAGSIYAPEGSIGTDAGGSPEPDASDAGGTVTWRF
jgi:RHS repeat-associated protein